MADVLLSGVRIALAVYVGLLLLVYLRQTSFLYHPEADVSQNPSNVGLTFRDLALTTEDGETIAGWYVPAENESAAPVLLFFHGNAGNISGRLESIRTFYDLGLGVVIIDYRGYGRSTGKPTERGTMQDADAAWRYVMTELKVAPENVIVFGRSLGGAVAISLAARQQPGLLLVESSFTSAVDMGQGMFPILPVRLLCRHPYDSVQTIRSVTCPVLIAHGPDDRTVPFVHGERLYAAANDPKRFVELSGGHNDGGMDYDLGYRAQFIDWLNAHLPDTRNQANGGSDGD